MTLHKLIHIISERIINDTSKEEEIIIDKQLIEYINDEQFIEISIPFIDRILKEYLKEKKKWRIDLKKFFSNDGEVDQWGFHQQYTLMFILLYYQNELHLIF